MTAATGSAGELGSFSALYRTEKRLELASHVDAKD